MKRKASFIHTKKEAQRENDFQISKTILREPSPFSIFFIRGKKLIVLLESFSKLPSRRKQKVLEIA